MPLYTSPSARCMCSADRWKLAAIGATHAYLADLAAAAQVEHDERDDAGALVAVGGALRRVARRVLASAQHQHVRRHTDSTGSSVDRRWCERELVLLTHPQAIDRALVRAAPGLLCLRFMPVVGGTHYTMNNELCTFNFVYQAHDSPTHLR